MVQDEWRLATAETRSVSVSLKAAANGDCVAALVENSEWRERERILLQRATHDSLTGALNREVLADRTRHALDRFARTGNPPALLFADLDGFKLVNDRYGHLTGDHVLRTTARRMQAAARPSDTFARIGGDEFAVLCEDLDSEDDAQHVAARLRAAVLEPVELDGQLIHIGVSFGVAFALHPEDTLAQLLERADADLYSSKHLRVRPASDATIVLRDDPGLDAIDALQTLASTMDVARRNVVTILAGLQGTSRVGHAVRHDHPASS
jgi:diguanylate cyclase (GGDEF)-like protein